MRAAAFSAGHLPGAPAERRPPAFPSATVRINADPPLILMNVMPARANVSDPIRGVRRTVDRKGGDHA